MSTLTDRIATALESTTGETGAAVETTSRGLEATSMGCTLIVTPALPVSGVRYTVTAEHVAHDGRGGRIVGQASADRTSVRALRDALAAARRAAMVLAAVADRVTADGWEVAASLPSRYSRGIEVRQGRASAYITSVGTVHTDDPMARTYLTEVWAEADRGVTSMPLPAAARTCVTS